MALLLELFSLPPAEFVDREEQGSESAFPSEVKHVSLWCALIFYGEQHIYMFEGWSLIDSLARVV